MNAQAGLSVLSAGFWLLQITECTTSWFMRATCDLSALVSAFGRKKLLNFRLNFGFGRNPFVYFRPPFGFGRNLKISFGRSLKAWPLITDNGGHVMLGWCELMGGYNTPDTVVKHRRWKGIPKMRKCRSDSTDLRKWLQNIPHFRAWSVTILAGRGWHKSKPLMAPVTHL